MQAAPLYNRNVHKCLEMNMKHAPVPASGEAALTAADVINASAVQSAMMIRSKKRPVWGLRREQDVELEKLPGILWHRTT
jgi:hypothetical protein